MTHTGPVFNGSVAVMSPLEEALHIWSIWWHHIILNFIWKRPRNFTLMILLWWSHQPLAVAVKVYADFVLSYLYILIKSVWKQSQQMSKYHPLEIHQDWLMVSKPSNIEWLRKPAKCESLSLRITNVSQFEWTVNPYITPTVWKCKTGMTACILLLGF